MSFPESVASAANFPSGYTGNTCDGVCVITGTTFRDITCTTDVGSCTGGASAWAVSNYDGGSGERDYSIWGITCQGDQFACFFDDTSQQNVLTLVVHGTDDTDALYLNYADGTYNLEAGGILMYATLYGYDGNDSLEGSYDSDVKMNESLRGGDGNDTLSGFNGADSLYGYLGNDTLHGGAGDDELHGDAGSDTLEGLTGVDTLYGGADDDILSGGPGDDALYGEGGDDQLDGDDDDDTCDGGDDNDTIRGGDGGDTLYGGGGADSLNGEAGNDLVYGDGGNDIVCGGTTTGPGVDTLHGGLGDDTLFESSGSNTPTGTDAGGTNYCGHTAHGSFLTAGSCSYTLTSASCP